MCEPGRGPVVYHIIFTTLTESSGSEWTAAAPGLIHIFQPEIVTCSFVPACAPLPQDPGGTLSAEVMLLAHKNSVILTICSSQ